MRMTRLVVVAATAALLATAACDAVDRSGTTAPSEGEPTTATTPEEASAEASSLTADELADAIADHVEAQADEEGYYHVTDSKTGEELALKLDEVHRDRLSKIDEDTYFACADFTSRDGTVYDLDVFMHGTDASDLEFEKFSVHKVGGEPRYTWYEEDGVWKKRDKSVEAEEHPEGEEHPEEEHSEEEHPEEEHPDEEHPEEEHPEGEEHPD